MTVGIARADRIFLSAAAGVGNAVVYVGSKTGRDGIHGATMASAEFGEDAEEKRPTVQVGDPFVEKLLIEACLELMATDAVVAIQDMGAAGLTSSSVEMAGAWRGRPRTRPRPGAAARDRHDGLRDDAVGKPGAHAVRAAPGPRGDGAGRSSINGSSTSRSSAISPIAGASWCVIAGVVEADIPLAPLADQAPLYHRPVAEPQAPAELGAVDDPVGVAEALMRLVACPDLCSRAWVWDQYDATVGGQTIRRPGAADAAIVRIEGFARALAMTTDCTPRYCAADPERGGAQAVAEAWRNLTATGARPAGGDRQHEFRQP